MALENESNGIGATMLVGPTGAPSYPYPMYYGGNGGFGGNGDWSWIIVLFLFAMMGGWGGMGFGGFGGFGGGLGIDFPWLLNGQNGINNNVSEGFRDAQLHDSITSVHDGLNGLATQLCGCCGDLQMSITNAQNSLAQQLYAGQLADLQQACDTKASIADLKYTVANEACADRAAVTAATQRILDQLCQDKIDAKNETIAQLRQELLFARGQASQDVQTARLLAGQTAEVDALYNRLSNCPVPSTPVYGRTPIFTCNNGCGCGAAANF